MRAKIFSFVKVSTDSMIASVRIARFLAKTLRVDVCWDESVAEEPLDVLVIVNGAFAFAGNTLLAALGTAIVSAGRVVWIQNDWTIIPPKDESNAESPFRAAFRTRRLTGMSPVDYWTTVEVMSRAGERSPLGHALGAGSAYVNWNALTFDPVRHTYAIPPKHPKHRDELIYYGSFRKDRVKYFDRYFREPKTALRISCPNRKFTESYAHELLRHEGKITEPMSIWLHRRGLGLYLEDTKSHSEFHSPANRFYEMLSAGLPMVFQPEAERMMGRAGYPVGDFVVWNALGVPAKMEMRDQIRQTQMESWWNKAHDEHVTLASRITQLWEALQ